MANFYDILGVARSAGHGGDPQGLRRPRPRSPPRSLHRPGREAARRTTSFAQITTAFNTLSNEASRQEYDQEVDRPKPQTPCGDRRGRPRRGAWPPSRRGSSTRPSRSCAPPCTTSPKRPRYHAAPRPAPRQAQGAGARGRSRASRRPSNSPPGSRSHHLGSGAAASSGSACGCVRSAPPRRRCGSRRETPMSGASRPNSVYPEGVHEHHQRGGDRRRAQAQGERGQLRREPRAQALRRVRRHGRPRRGRGGLARSRSTPSPSSSP